MSDPVISRNSAMTVAASALRAQQSRMRVIAENIANADSTSAVAGGDPYRRQVPVFRAQQMDGATGVVLAEVRADPGQFNDSQSSQWSRHHLPPFVSEAHSLYLARTGSIQRVYRAAMNYTGIGDLTVGFDGGVLSLTFNRPDSLNSLTEAMLKTVADTLERAATDPDVKVVRLGGAGRGFSSGAGISADDQAAATVSMTVDPLLAEANRAVRAIAALP